MFNLDMMNVIIFWFLMTSLILINSILILLIWDQWKLSKKLAQQHKSQLIIKINQRKDRLKQLNEDLDNILKSKE